jgi:hypothetical protein
MTVSGELPSCGLALDLSSLSSQLTIPSTNIYSAVPIECFILLEAFQR